MNTSLLYILFSVIAGGAGQVILKKGMSDIGPLTLSLDQMGHVLWRMLTNGYVIVGLSIYAISSILWLTALSRVNLSFAYPFVSLGYVIMLVASWQLFHENISLLRLLGCVVIILGVIMVSRT